MAIGPPFIELGRPAWHRRGKPTVVMNTLFAFAMTLLLAFTLLFPVLGKQVEGTVVGHGRGHKNRPYDTVEYVVDGRTYRRDVGGDHGMGRRVEITYLPWNVEDGRADAGTMWILPAIAVVLGLAGVGLGVWRLRSERDKALERERFHATAVRLPATVVGYQHQGPSGTIHVVEVRDPETGAPVQLRTILPAAQVPVGAPATVQVEPGGHRRHRVSLS